MPDIDDEITTTPCLYVNVNLKPTSVNVARIAYLCKWLYGMLSNICYFKVINYLMVDHIYIIDTLQYKDTV